MFDQHVGKHCSIETCKQKDWLPINCKYCTKIFCSDHYSIQSHNCPNHQKVAKKVFECPLCSKVLQMNPNLSVNENFQIHQAMDCQRDFQKNEKKPMMCQGKLCKAKLTELNKYQCKSCVKNLCLKHRLQQAHECKVFG